MSTDNRWTVMFYFGGDNALSPLVVPQIKAIKDAGFEANTEVVVYFDTNERGVPTRIYNVNNERKAKKTPPRTDIGDGNDPYVRNMMEDIVDPTKLDGDPGSAVAKMKEGLMKPDSQTATEALENFLGYCRAKHKANRYVLILVGHGMIVGNDSFLPDDFPQSGIGLKQLAAALKGFSTGGDTTLELLAMHSCSMSALEISYELKGLANYMLSSQGLSYVGSWPYRQLLKKAFNSINTMTGAGTDDEDSLRMIEKLYYLTFYNARDFAIAGYSLDLALTNLKTQIVKSIDECLGILVTRLREALDTRQDLILLSHWESQSYWQEDYTDLFDFCFCLRRRCEAELKRIEEQKCGDPGVAERLRDAAKDVLTVLTPVDSADLEKRFARLVVHADNFGWKYQYSHGLSVYFPWSEPFGDVEKSIMKNYEGYAFHTEAAKGHSWLDFLKDYFKNTKRKPRRVEEGRPEKESDVEIMGSHGFNWMNLNPFGPLGDDPKPSPAYSGDPGKPSPSQGGGCSCATIKNYPSEPMPIDGKTQVAPVFSITDGARKSHELID